MVKIENPSALFGKIRTTPDRLVPPGSVYVDYPIREIPDNHGYLAVRVFRTAADPRYTHQNTDGRVEVLGRVRETATRGKELDSISETEAFEKIREKYRSTESASSKENQAA